MLVSGGQILAIDKVNTGNTILGDGVQKPLDVNTDLIATTSSVSSVSSLLEQQIDSVSSNFQYYYKKTETSGADEISAAFENFKTNQTIVSAGSPNVIVSAIPSGDKTIIYRVEVQEGEINIEGASGISAKYDDGTWTLGLSANFLSANALEDYYKKSETSAANEISTEFANTSAWANETFLKEHQSLDDYYKKSETSAAEEISAAITALSSWADETFLKEHQSLDDYYKKSETSGADEISNALLLKQDVSAMSAYATSAWVDENYQKKGKYVTSADDELAGKQLVLKDNEWQELEEHDWSDEIAAASAAAVTSAKNYTDTKLEDYYNKSETSSRNQLEEEFAKYQLKGDYLSANALDEVSGAWNSVVDTVSSYSGYWNDVSAYSATSGQFVTSAIDNISAGLANVLVKDEEDNVTWSGVDLSKLGKIYGMSSQTPDLLTVGISADEETQEPIYVLSAAEPAQIVTPDISGYGLSAWKDTEEDKYFVSANIVGNHGVSAAYDAEANTWNLGISANDYAFLFGSYTNAVPITDGTCLKLESSNKHLIVVDEQGYITLPETTNKFTFCINEYVDSNTTENHEYLLNKLVLSAKDNDAIVASQNFYPSEVGSSNVTIAITIDNTAAVERQYCIVYKGSDVAANKLRINASILEEVTSLDSTGGAIEDYTGEAPIYVNDNTRRINLEYDENVFKLVEDELGVKKLTIDAGSETVDAQKFEKMAELIDTRMTETFPIGLTCEEGVIGANKCVSYMFRPTMSYDLTSATSAFIYHGNDDGSGQARVGVYKINDNGTANLLWKSALTNMTSAAGHQDVLPAASDSPSGVVSTDGLYYASILTNQSKQITNALGVLTKATGDVGKPQPWAIRDNISNNDTPFSGQDFASTITNLTDFGTFTDTIKPYIGFRGTI